MWRIILHIDRPRQIKSKVTHAKSVKSITISLLFPLLMQETHETPSTLSTFHPSMLPITEPH